MKYGSKEFWELLSPDVQYVSIDNGDSHLTLWLDNAPPVREAVLWVGGGYAQLSFRRLRLTELPDWTQSLIKRPYRWQRPTAATPMDAPVWVYDASKSRWVPQHWATNDRCWERGGTSATTEYFYAPTWVVLPHPTDPDLRPLESPRALSMEETEA